VNVQHIYESGLCMQCGTCAALCPSRAITLKWTPSPGCSLRIDRWACVDCGRCLQACPGAGIDFRPTAWWRSANEGAPSRDFLGPWRGLWFGWAADDHTRHVGASGGVATAVLQGLLAQGRVDAALVAGLSPENPLVTQPRVARTSAEVAACRGSKYNVVAMNLALKLVLEEPGRYVLVGLPCHIQGLRLAQRRSRRLRERVVLTLGLFCGFTNEPRGTAIAARRAGMRPEDLASVSYRGPGWPGVLRLVTRAGEVREVAYPDYHDGYMTAHVPRRCRMCPDALAELADISVGDAWLQRFAGSDGVSDVIVRTPAGERIVADLTPDWLTLSAASPEDMVASQVAAYHSKRLVGRGRLWWRAAAGRAVPDYPGVPYTATPRDRLAAFSDIVREASFRIVGNLRYR
jgi:coenzyme F420 hydrogenase subunit beta